MKKIFALILTLTLALGMVACGGSNTDNGGAASDNNAGTVNSNSETPIVPADGFVFTYNGIEIALHANAAPIIKALGEEEK